MERSELRNAAALTRLWLILATATLYVVSTGTAAVMLAWFLPRLDLSKILIFEV